MIDNAKSAFASIVKALPPAFAARTALFGMMALSITVGAYGYRKGIETAQLQDKISDLERGQESLAKADGRIVSAMKAERAELKDDLTRRLDRLEEKIDRMLERQARAQSRR